jgi:Rrf2 family protein
MRISTRGVYALEAMLVLASQPEAERASIRQISDQTGLSDSYLEQIFALLRKSGLLSSTRGNRGGYALAKPASEITVGDIVRSAEGSLHPVACTDGTEPGCERYGSCLSRAVWGRMAEEISLFVDPLRLSDLVQDYLTSGIGPDMEVYI